MKRALPIALCLAMLACASDATFNRVQPLGQKSVYKMQNEIKSEYMSLSVDRKPRVSEVTVSAVLETDVTASEKDGNWTLSNRFTQVDAKMDGESRPEASGLLIDKPFSTTMDKYGKVVQITGIESDQGLNIEQILSQLSPTAMLPTGPVKIGESWPFEITPSAQGNRMQTIKGVGVLKALNGDEASMEFDFIIQITTTGSPQMEVNGTGSGKTSAVYDTDKARFISNKSDVTIETSGRLIMGEKSEAIRNTFTSSTKVELVNR